ncbi:MAG: HEAT repeat domain-containing protein [Bryobacterales bacterium]|nr:HEAT repeat domain-containing protein [Bryobacterales bacterium]
MNCTEVLDALALYLYGELPPRAEEEVEAHLHGCPACRDALDAQQRLHHAFDRARAVPRPDLVAECRGELFRRTAARPGWRQRLARAWDLTRVRWVLRPAGALALVAVGFLSARLPLRDSGLLRAPAEPPVATVRWVEPDPSGGVRIALDETRRRVIRGSLEDRLIEKLLLEAARDQANAGLRVESIDLLKDRSGNDDVRQALLQAATHDRNPGVRLKALEGLKGMASHPEVRAALPGILERDDNENVRILAIDMLVQNRDEQIVGLLQGLVGQEENSYVRMRVRSVLEEMKASVGTF